MQRILVVAMLAAAASFVFIQTTRSGADPKGSHGSGRAAENLDALY